METITVFSAQGGNGCEPSRAGLRQTVTAFLWCLIFLIPASAFAAQASGRATAGGESSGILPVSLGRPAGCGFTSANALNNGSYPEELAVAGSVWCPGLDGEYPYAWQASGWQALELPDDPFGGGRALSISGGSAGDRAFTYVLWNEAGSLDAYVLEAGGSPVKLALLPDMIGSDHAVLTEQGNHIVGDNQTADWTYRAARWVREGDGWSDPEDLGPGRALAASEDGTVVVGISDPWAWDGDPGPWVWSAEGGETTLLDPGASVADIAHDGSIIVGRRQQACSDPDRCDFYPVPVYWVREEAGWVMHDLEALDGVDSGASSVAIVDGTPVIVGFGYTNQQGGILRPVVWMQDQAGGFGPPLRLEALGAHFNSWSEAQDINRNGMVLGWSEIEPFLGSTDVIWNLFEAFPFQINRGISDAWYEPATDGQGFFITVSESTRSIFLAWFTYDTNRPGASVSANLGDPGHRWLTAQGSYVDDTAELEITVTEGGVFDTSPPTPVRRSDGTMTLQFSNCVSGTVSYDIPSIGRQGVVPIRRVGQDNVGHCERLAMPTQ